MEVKEYESAQAFLKDYEMTMLEKEALSQLILLDAFQNRKNPSTDKGVYGAVIDQDKALLLFCNAPQNLILFAANPGEMELAATTLADYLGSSRVLVNGINARKDICDKFMDQYKKHVNCTFTEILGADIMEIRKVNEIKPAEGIQRLALQEDAKLIVDWMIELKLDLNSVMDYEAVLQKARNYISNQKVYLFENTKQQIVSMAVTEHRLVHGMALSYVFTPEEFRGEGYAAANVYYLCKDLLEQGYKFCTLFVDKKNPLSNRAYEKVGFVILEDNYEYKVIAAENKAVI